MATHREVVAADLSSIYPTELRSMIHFRAAELGGRFCFDHDYSQVPSLYHSFRSWGAITDAETGRDAIHRTGSGFSRRCDHEFIHSISENFKRLHRYTSHA